MLRLPRSGVGTLLSLAMVLAAAVRPLVPPEHLHRAGIEGRVEPLVHAHVGDTTGVTTGSTGPALKSSHGDHALSIVLTAEITAAAHAETPAAGLPGAAVAVLAVPDRQGFARVSDDRRIHAPPGAAWIARGPPLRS